MNEYYFKLLALTLPPEWDKFSGRRASSGKRELGMRIQLTPAFRLGFLSHPPTQLRRRRDLFSNLKPETGGTFWKISKIKLHFWLVPKVPSQKPRDKPLTYNIGTQHHSLLPGEMPIVIGKGEGPTQPCSYRLAREWLREASPKNFRLFCKQYPLRARITGLRNSLSLAQLFSSMRPWIPGFQPGLKHPKS